MNGITTGDLTRPALLRQANVALKQRLATLTAETASGQHADIGAALAGNTRRLALVEARLTTLGAQGNLAAAAMVDLKAMEDSVAAIRSMSSDHGPELLAASTTADAGEVRLRADQAAHDLTAVARQLNVQAGGRFLFGGAATDTPPIARPEALLDEVRSVVTGLTDPAAVARAVTAWFAAPPGEGGFMDRHMGTASAPLVFTVSPDDAAITAATATDAPFRQALAGLAMAALAGDPQFSAAQGRHLLSAAGTELASAADPLIETGARVGLDQARMERATARIASETAALSLARSGMLAVDPYETASALTETETRLEALYAVTARLSKLSLAAYLG